MDCSWFFNPFINWNLCGFQDFRPGSAANIAADIIAEGQAAIEAAMRHVSGQSQIEESFKYVYV